MLWLHVVVAAMCIAGLPGIKPVWGVEPGLAEAEPAASAAMERARMEFEVYAAQWVDLVSRNLMHTREEMEIAAEADGSIAARYVEVDRDAVALTVKASASGGAACPFIGVLRYVERRYESRGASEDEARAGPFSRVGAQRVTEIFRYVNGRWTN